MQLSYMITPGRPPTYTTPQHDELCIGTGIIELLRSRR
jgi:hypothetical protein